MNSLVSIVIPTHNRCDLLIRAVRSACSQTYGNIEIIVVSDGSKDNTDSEMKRLAGTDSRIKYYSYETSKGGNYARNLGIKAAKGEYVAFLDDDDVWHSSKIELQMQMFNNDENIGLVCTAFYAIYEGENYKTLYIPPAPYDSSYRILIENCIGSTTTVMVKKHLLEKVNMFDENLKAQQDYDLWIRLCQITKIGVVRTPCVDYYNYPSSNQISQQTEKYRIAVDYIEHKYQDLFFRLKESDLKQRRVIQKLVIAKKALRNSERSLALKSIVDAMKIKPTTEAVGCLFALFMPPKVSRVIRGTLRSIKYRIKGA